LENDVQLTNDGGYGGDGPGGSRPLISFWVNAPGDGEAFDPGQLEEANVADTDDRCFVGPYDSDEVNPFATRCFNGATTLPELRTRNGVLELQTISLANPVANGEYQIGVAYYYFGRDDYNEGEIPSSVDFKLTMVKDGVATLLSSPVPQVLTKDDPAIGAPFDALLNYGNDDIPPPGIIYKITY
jgi:hypothetical protein